MRQVILMRNSILHGQAPAVTFLGLQRQVGKGLLLAHGVRGQIPTKGIGNETGFSTISNHTRQE